MEPPTLDGLVKEVDIPLALLGQKCSDEHLTKISSFLDWRTVAPHLGLNTTEIDEIESKKTETEKRLATLQKWKQKFGYMAKFKSLVEVLLNVGNAEHAEKVCRLLQAQPQVHTEPTEQPETPSTTVKVATITTESLKQNIEKEIQELEDQFSTVVDKARYDLEKSDLSMVKLRITQLPAFLQYERIKLLQENHPAIKNAKSVGEVFSTLSPYWDFLNCGLLNEIVRKLGNYETKQLMEKYAEKLREFRMKTKLEDFIGKWARSCPAHFSEVVSEMGVGWRDRTLEDLEKLRFELARTMYIEEYALHCTRIKPGPLSVTWAIPSSLPGVVDTLQSIFPLLEEKHNVVMVVFQGRHIPELSGVPLESPYDSGLELEWDVFFTDKDRERRALELHRRREKELLLELQKKPEGKPPTPKKPRYEKAPELPQEPHQFSSVQGTFVTSSDCMFIASVGSERPPGTKVVCKPSDKDRAQHALKIHGRLPPTPIKLPGGTEVDLVIVSRLIREHPRKNLVSLNLDIPGRERSKDYYLQEMEKFLKECEKPGATIWYTGRSEQGTGDWCFEDGTISLQEIFDLYRAHFRGKYLGIVSDCCYSGKWVHTCAEMLDNMGIPPCGHKAREQGVMIKVFGSCQSDQRAGDPCYSVEGVEFSEEDQCMYFNSNKQLTENQASIKGDFNKLVCCKGPDDDCPAESEFKNWKWADAVSGEMWTNIRLMRSIDRGSQSWYYVLLYSGDEEHRTQFKAQAPGIFDVADWGYVLASGWGKDPPRSIQDKIRQWTGVSTR